MSSTSSKPALADTSTKIIKKTTTSIVNQSTDAIIPKRSGLPVPRSAIKRSTSSSDALSITPTKSTALQEHKEPSSPLTPDVKKTALKRPVSPSISPSPKPALTSSSSSLAAKRANLKPNLSIKPAVRFGSTTDLSSQTPPSHRSASPSISRLPTHHSKSPSINVSKPSHAPSDSLSSSQTVSLSHLASQAGSTSNSAAHTRSNSLFSEWEEQFHATRFGSRSSSISSTSSLSEIHSAVQSSTKHVTRSRMRSASAQINSPLSASDFSPQPSSPSPYAQSSYQSCSSPTNHGKKENIHVFVRCRPFLEHELCKKAPHLQLSGPTRSVSVTYRNRARNFTFDGVFDQAADQSTIYQSVAAPLVEQALSGYNATIFAYGQTSSGKSYTMLGSLGRPSDEDYNESTSVGQDDIPDMGIIPRAVRHIFDYVDHKNQETLDRIRKSTSSSTTSPEQSSNISPNATITQPISQTDQPTHSSAQEMSIDIFYTVSISYLEIYNEKVSDLLGDPVPHDPNNPLPHPLKPELEIREQDGTFFAPDLTRHVCMTRNRLLHLIDRGNAGRNVASTTQNSRSSRSHAILTLYIDKRVLNPMHPPTNQSIMECSELLMQSKLNLVDLAGSERLTSSTKAKQGRETLSINLSLSCLSNVIMSLTENLLPSYRDSKLTRLLKDSLGGSSKCCMIACISPNGGQSGNQAANQTVSETVSTLRWAERTKRVKNQPLISDSERADARLIELKAEVQAMRTKMLGRNKDMIRMLWLVKSLTEDQPLTPFGPLGDQGGANVDLDLTEAILMDPFSHPMAGMIVNDQTSDNEEESPIDAEECEDVAEPTEAQESVTLKTVDEESKENPSEDAASTVSAAPPVLFRERSASHRATNSVNFFKLFKQTMSNVHHQIKMEVPPVPAFDEECSYDKSAAQSLSGSVDWQHKYEVLLGEFESLKAQTSAESGIWDSTKQQLLNALAESERENATLNKRVKELTMLNDSASIISDSAKNMRALSCTMSHAEVKAILSGATVLSKRSDHKDSKPSDELASLRAETQRLERSIMSLKESHLQEMNNMNSILAERQLQLQLESANSKQMQVSSQQSLRDMKQLIVSAQDDVRNIRASFAQENSLLQQTQQRNKELELELSRSLGRCNSQLVNAEMRCEDARQAVSQLVLEYHTRYDQFSLTQTRLEQEKQHLVCMLEQSQSETNLLCSQREAWSTEKAHLEKAVAELQVKVISAETQASLSSASDHSSKQALLDSSEDKERLQQTLDVLQQRVASAEERSEQRSQTINELQLDYHQKYHAFESSLVECRQLILSLQVEKEKLLVGSTSMKEQVSLAEERTAHFQHIATSAQKEYNMRFADFEHELAQVHCQLRELSLSNEGLTSELSRASENIKVAEARTEHAQRLLESAQTEYKQRYDQFAASLSLLEGELQLKSVTENDLDASLATSHSNATHLEQRAQQLQEQVRILRQEYQERFAQFDGTLKEYEHKFNLLSDAKVSAESLQASWKNRVTVAEERADLVSESLEELRSEYRERFSDFARALQLREQQLCLAEDEKVSLSEHNIHLQLRLSQADVRADLVVSESDSQFKEYERRYSTFESTLSALMERFAVLSAEKNELSSLVAHSHDQVLQAEHRAEFAVSSRNQLDTEYTKRFQAFDSELATVNETISVLKLSNQQYESLSQQLQQERDELVRSINQMKDEHADHAQTIASLNAENKELHIAASHMQLVLTELKCADALLQGRLDTAMHHSLSQSSHVIQLQDELSAARKQITELMALNQTTLDAARQTEANLLLTINQTVSVAEQRAKDAIQQKDEQAAVSVSQMASEREALQHERDTLMQTINNLRLQSEQHMSDKELVTVREQTLLQEVVDFKQSIDQLNQENLELEQCLLRVTTQGESDKSSLTQSLEQSNLCITQLKQEISGIKELAQSLASKLQMATDARDELQTQLSQSTNQNIAQQEQLHQSIHQTETLQRELSAARSQLASLDITFQSVRQSIQETSDQANIAHNQAIVIAEQRVELFRSRLDAVQLDYKDRFGQFARALQSNKQTIDQLMQARNVADVRLRELTIIKNDEISALNQRIFELQTKNVQDSLLAQQDKLRSINHPTDVSVDEDKRANSEILSELSEKNIQLAACQAELAGVRAQLVELQSVNHAISAKVLEHQSHIDGLMQQLQQAEHVRTIESAALTDVRQRLEQATADRANIDGQCRSLRQQLLEQKARRVTAGQSGSSMLASMELAVKTDQLAKNEVRMKDLSEKLSMAAEQLAARDVTVVDLTARLSELQQLFDSHTQQAEHDQLQHRQQIDELTAHLAERTQEQSNLSLQVQEHVNQLTKNEHLFSTLSTKHQHTLSQVSILTSQLSDKAEELSKSQGDSRSLHEHIVELNLEVASSADRISALETTVAQLECNVTSVKDKLTTADSDLSTKSEVIAALTNELSESQHHSTQLAQQNSTHVIALNVQSDQLTKADASITSLREQLYESEKHLAAVTLVHTQSVSQHQERIETLSKQCTQQSIELDKERRAVQSLRSQLDNALAESTRISVEFADFTRNQANTDAASREWQQRFTIQSAELTEALEQTARLQSERDILQRQLDESVSQVMLLASQVQRSDQSLTDHVQTISDIRGQLRKSEEVESGQSVKVHSLLQQLRALESTIITKQSMFDEQLTIVSSKNVEITSLSARLSTSQESLDQANLSIERKSQQINEIAQHIVELEAELADEQSINESLNQLLSEKSAELSAKTIQLIQHDAQIKALHSEVERSRATSSGASKLSELAAREAKLHTQIEKIVKTKAASNESRRENQSSLLAEIKRLSEELEKLTTERNACQTLIEKQASEIASFITTVEKLNLEHHICQEQMSEIQRKLKSEAQQALEESQHRTEEVRSQLADKEREYQERFELFDRELADVHKISDAKIQASAQTMQQLEEAKLSYTARYTDLEAEFARWKQLHQGDFCSKLSHDESLKASEVRAENARSRLAEVENEYAARYQQFERELTRIQQSQQGHLSSPTPHHIPTSQTIGISSRVSIYSINWEQRLIELRHIHCGNEVAALHALIDEQRAKLDDTINQLEALQEQSQHDKQLLQAEIDHLRATAALVCSKYEACVASKLELIRSTNTEVTRLKDHVNRNSRRYSDDIEWKEADDPSFNLSNRQPADANCVIS